MGVIVGLLSVVYVFACLFLIFVVLIQKGEGGGLGGAFGGGAVDVAFGASADTTWKKATSVAAGIFIILSIVLGLLENPEGSSALEKDMKNKQTATKGAGASKPGEVLIPGSGDSVITSPGGDEKDEGEGRPPQRKSDITPPTKESGDDPKAPGGGK